MSTLGIVRKRGLKLQFSKNFIQKNQPFRWQRFWSVMVWNVVLRIVQVVIRFDVVFPSLSSAMICCDNASLSGADLIVKHGQLVTWWTIHFTSWPNDYGHCRVISVNSPRPHCFIWPRHKIQIGLVTVVIVTEKWVFIVVYVKSHMWLHYRILCIIYTYVYTSVGYYYSCCILLKFYSDKYNSKPTNRNTVWHWCLTLWASWLIHSPLTSIWQHLKLWWLSWG